MTDFSIWGHERVEQQMDNLRVLLRCWWRERDEEDPRIQHERARDFAIGKILINNLIGSVERGSCVSLLTGIEPVEAVRFVGGLCDFEIAGHHVLEPFSRLPLLDIRVIIGESDDFNLHVGHEVFLPLETVAKTLSQGGVLETAVHPIHQF